MDLAIISSRLTDANFPPVEERAVRTPFGEAVVVITKPAGREVAYLPRYMHDGPERLRAHVEQWLGRKREHVSDRDYVVFGHQVRTITDRQWATLEEIRAAVPDAHVDLH